MILHPHSFAVLRPAREGHQANKHPKSTSIPFISSPPSSQLHQTQLQHLTSFPITVQVMQTAFPCPEEGTTNWRWVAPKNTMRALASMERGRQGKEREGMQQVGQRES